MSFASRGGWGSDPQMTGCSESSEIIIGAHELRAELQELKASLCKELRREIGQALDDWSSRGGAPPAAGAAADARAAPKGPGPPAAAPLGGGCEEWRERLTGLAAAGHAPATPLAQSSEEFRHRLSSWVAGGGAAPPAPPSGGLRQTAGTPRAGEGWRRPPEGEREDCAQHPASLQTLRKATDYVRRAKTAQGEEVLQTPHKSAERFFPRLSEASLPGEVEPSGAEQRPRIPLHTAKTLTPAETGKLLSGRARTISIRFNHKAREAKHTKVAFGFNKVKALARSIKAKASPNALLDALVSVAIVMNGLLVGLQVDHMAQNTTDNIPLFYAVSETIFCVIFAVELGTKLAQHRMRFYTMPGWRWNVFDTFLVAMQLGDVFVEIIFSSSDAARDAASAMRNAFFLRLLRLLRLLRILRLIRLFQFFNELNLVTSAVASAMSSLFGTTLMLVLVMYIIGIVFTQLVTAHRVSLLQNGQDADGSLSEWWGTLSRSMLSLYQSFLGGVDWDTLARPLLSISPGLVVLFVLYIAFITLAMMNVITGIFVESAIKNAEKQKDKALSNHLKNLSTNKDGTTRRTLVKKEDFRRTLHDKELQIYFADMGIDPDEAVNLFDLMAMDSAEGIEMEDLVQGILRLREGAKYLDIVTVLCEVEQRFQTFVGHLQRTDDASASMSKLAEQLLYFIMPPSSENAVYRPHTGPSGQEWV